MVGEFGDLIPIHFLEGFFFFVCVILDYFFFVVSERSQEAYLAYTQNEYI